MSTIQWRPEVNALTRPQSYSMRYIPKAVLGPEELAAEMAKKNPVWSTSTIMSFFDMMASTVQEQLIQGNQVTLTGSFTFGISFTGKLDTPTASLPANNEMLQVRVYASQPFVNEVRRRARLERLKAVEKVPVISSIDNTYLKLPDVLSEQYMIRATGNRMLFPQGDPDCGCFLEGTRAGKKMQSKFGLRSNKELLIIPEIPTQPEPWNNEYIFSVSTRYTARGTLRTSTYRRKLRTPLVVAGFGQPNQEVGILTGSAETPYVMVTGGTVATNEMLRIQVVFDVQRGTLLFRLLDMQDGGRAGDVITIRENGDYSLPGFSDSGVTSLGIKVMQFSQLLDLVRHDYLGRLIDILDVKA